MCYSEVVHCPCLIDLDKKNTHKNHGLIKLVKEYKQNKQFNEIDFVILNTIRDITMVFFKQLERLLKLNWKKLRT